MPETPTEMVPVTTELALRPTESRPSPRALYQQRMEGSRQRMRTAMQRVRERAHDLTPAARISARPQAWILGGLLLGLAFGLMTGGRRRY